METGFTFEEMWEKIIACDRNYDGLSYTAVKTTKIYCRPSCRSRIGIAAEMAEGKLTKEHFTNETGIQKVEKELVAIRGI